jgi:peptidyl-prolyl cis-trans isomerase SurA
MRKDGSDRQVKGERQVTAGRMKKRPSLWLRKTIPLMMTPRRALTGLLLSASLLAPLALPAPVLARDAAPSPFSVVLKVNDLVITQYELDQRKRFLMLLRAPGDPEKEALRGLTQDRLAMGEAKRFKIKLTKKQVEDGLTEFASRANLSAEQFVTALGQGGVSPQTFRDFVGNGLLWRELVRGHFLSAVSVSDAEIDRAIANGTHRTAMQLLLSELVIPVEGDPEDELARARQLKLELTSEGAFASAARRYSASPSAGRGGRLDWTPASNLPPALVQMVLALGPGQTSDPFVLPNAVALFQLRDVTEDQTTAPPKVRVEYAEFLLPNTATVQADAAALGNRVDSCKDLYAEARGLPEDRLTVKKSSVDALPGDVALQLAQLDPGEASTALTRGPWRVYLMLCSREPMPTDTDNPDAEIDRNGIRDAIIAQELSSRADGYLEELRSEAIIKQP